MMWLTSRRTVRLDRTVVMAILNVTPDSFSDGGNYSTADAALARVEQMLDEGADIIDVGGESTRPGSARVDIEEETRRVVPVIEAIAKRFDVPVSVDTTKSVVAERAVSAGAEIINDISALRFDECVGEVAGREKTGLVLMHSLGDFAAMHRQEPLAEITADVVTTLAAAVEKATSAGVERERIALDIGIGFGKTPWQNLELLAKLGKIKTDLPGFPMLIGTSRKSFIGKILGDAAVDERLAGSLATVAVAVWNGANVVRVHDVRETVMTVRSVDAIKAAL
jgi:dihydropteroate synthase